MSEVTELLEQMEHAGHAGHGGGHGGAHAGPGKGIGITMAMLGVMLAFCAAMVGSARTELIKATVEQSNKWSIYQGESTKFRIMEADVEMLRALTPSHAELDHFAERLATIKRPGGKSDDEDTTELKEAVHVATTELADVLTPDKDDEDRLRAIGANYKRDMAEAREDAEAYDDVIEAHHESAEWFERAQLCAEIGIVIASIALLMASRGVWAVSLLIGLTGAGLIVYTFVHARSELTAAEAKVEAAAKNTAVLEQDDEDNDEGDAGPGAASSAESPRETPRPVPSASGTGSARPRTVP